MPDPLHGVACRRPSAGALAGRIGAITSSRSDRPRVRAHAHLPARGLRVKKFAANPAAPGQHDGTEAAAAFPRLAVPDDHEVENN